MSIEILKAAIYAAGIVIAIWGAVRASMTGAIDRSAYKILRREEPIWFWAWIVIYGFGALIFSYLFLLATLEIKAF